jgi:hypothetical protein
MRKKEVGEYLIFLEAICQGLHGLHTHPVVTHEDLLDVGVVLQGFGDGTYLLVGQHVLYQVQISQRQQLE